MEDSQEETTLAFHPGQGDSPRHLRGLKGRGRPGFGRGELGMSRGWQIFARKTQS